MKKLLTYKKCFLSQDTHFERYLTNICSDYLETAAHSGIDENLLETNISDLKPIYFNFYGSKSSFAAENLKISQNQVALFAKLDPFWALCTIWDTLHRLGHYVRQDSSFNISMGSGHGAEVCQLVGWFLMFKIREKKEDLFGCRLGLYRDDFIGYNPSKSARSIDKLKQAMTLSTFKILMGSLSEESCNKVPSQKALCHLSNYQNAYWNFIPDTIFFNYSSRTS